MTDYLTRPIRISALFNKDLSDYQPPVSEAMKGKIHRGIFLTKFPEETENPKIFRTLDTGCQTSGILY